MFPVKIGTGGIQRYSQTGCGVNIRKNFKNVGLAFIPGCFRTFTPPELRTACVYFRYRLLLTNQGNFWLLSEVRYANTFTSPYSFIWQKHSGIWKAPKLWTKLAKPNESNCLGIFNTEFANRHRSPWIHLLEKNQWILPIINKMDFTMGCYLLIPEWETNFLIDFISFKSNLTGGTG